LHSGNVRVCVYAFDLLELEGHDLLDEPLDKRARLKRLLARSKGKLLRFSDRFPDASVLLAECVRLGLEGIVCKREDAPYRSDPRSGWVKVKTEEWKAANQYRAKLFEKS
jgi:bifunctional non-homologous end joining protein LigD